MLLVMVSFSAGGCGVANRLVLTSTDRVVATPAQVGLPYRDIWVSGAGTRLNGWYVPGAPSKPLILMFHGNAANISDCVDYVSLFHENGFSVCLFDYRGYGVSSGAPLGEEDLYEDARNVLSFVKSCGWRSDNIIYYGQSLGAAVAVQMAIEDPPAGVVLESPFTSFAAVATYHSPVGYPLLGRLVIDMPFENAAKIGRIDAPLLIIHGDSDEVVPVEMSLQLFARARRDKKLHVIRGGGHCDRFSGETAAVSKIIATFAAAGGG